MNIDLATLLSGQPARTGDVADGTQPSSDATIGFVAALAAALGAGGAVATEGGPTPADPVPGRWPSPDLAATESVDVETTPAACGAAEGAAGTWLAAVTPSTDVAVEASVDSGSDLRVGHGSGAAAGPTSDLAVEPSSDLGVDPSGDLGVDPDGDLSVDSSSDLSVDSSSDLSVDARRATADPVADATDGDGVPDGTGTSAAHPRGESSPVTPGRDAAPSGLAERIRETVERLRHSAPPRTVTLDLGETRVAVSVRGDTVHLAFQGAALSSHEAAAWHADLATTLATRGLALAAGTPGDASQEEAGHRDQADADEDQPTDHSQRPPRRRPDDGRGLRL